MIRIKIQNYLNQIKVGFKREGKTKIKKIYKIWES